MFTIITMTDKVMAKCKDGTNFNMVFPFTNAADADLAMARAKAFVADHAAGKINVNKAKWNELWHF